MKASRKFDINAFNSVPDQFVEQVDGLLEHIGSNNRVRNYQSLSDYSKEHFTNKSDRLKYVLAFDKQIVVGIIILFKRKIMFRGKNIELGGIGGVGTKKEYRGKGIATEMLDLSMKALAEANCDIACLGTNIDNPVLLKIYRRLGFVLLLQPLTFLGLSGKRYYENCGLIAPIKSHELFQEVLGENEPFYIGRGAW